MDAPMFMMKQVVSNLLFSMIMWLKPDFHSNNTLCWVSSNFKNCFEWDCHKLLKLLSIVFLLGSVVVTKNYVHCFLRLMGHSACSVSFHCVLKPTVQYNSMKHYKHCHVKFKTKGGECSVKAFCCWCHLKPYSAIQLDHLPYRPYLTPSYYHLFLNL